jgi:hypothetical protein
MTVKIVESLENLIKLTPDVQSILILDRDGVPIVSAGEDIRNRSQYSVSYNTLVEQARKLGMGTQKFWIFRYEMNQVNYLLICSNLIVFILGCSTQHCPICRFYYGIRRRQHRHSLHFAFPIEANFG